MSRTLAHVLPYVSCCSTAAAPLRSRRRRLGVGGCAVESLADGGGVFYIYVAWFDDSDDGHHHHGGAPDCHLALLPSALSRLLLAMLRRAASAAAAAASSTIIIFLGPPGVGKGTYASRIAAAAGGVHIAAGDLVRTEIAQGSTLGAEMRKAAASGQLLGDEVIVDLVSARVAECAAESRRMAEAGGSNEAMQEKKGDGNAGSPLDAAAARGVTGAEQLQGWPVFVLDGVPRTVAQAEMLETRGIVPSGASISDVHKSVRVVNLRMREEALIDKLLARRSCGECGRGFNVADIDLPEDTSRGLPRVRLLPMNPPDSCRHKMTAREDDTEEVIRRRLRIHQQESTAVEEFYRARGLVIDFEIQYGIPETMGVLQERVLHDLKLNKSVCH